MRVDSRKSKQAAVIARAPSCAPKERLTVKKGDVFIRSWMIDRMPRSVQLVETQYESWVDASRYELWWVAANADADEVEHELKTVGWLFFSTENVLKASAFGCDSGVSERALSRALQKAADQDITAVEIADITIEQEPWMTCVSMLARPRELQRCAVLDRDGTGACFSIGEFKDEQSGCVTNLKGISERRRL